MHCAHSSPKLSAAAGAPIRRLQLKGLGGFAVAPAGAPRLAAYVAESKGSPGFVGIWDHAALPTGGDPPPPIARRSFFRVGLICAADWKHSFRAVQAGDGRCKHQGWCIGVTNQAGRMVTLPLPIFELLVLPPSSQHGRCSHGGHLCKQLGSVVETAAWQCRPTR